MRRAIRLGMSGGLQGETRINKTTNTSRAGGERGRRDDRGSGSCDEGVGGTGATAEGERDDDPIVTRGDGVIAVVADVTGGVAARGGA